MSYYFITSIVHLCSSTEYRYVCAGLLPSAEAGSVMLISSIALTSRPLYHQDEID